MLTLVSAVMFAIAAISSLWGIRVEFRQRLETGPVALIPTLPFAIQSSIFVLIGLFIYGRGHPLPIWVFGLGLLGPALLGGAAIVVAGRIGNRMRRR